ncbi:MAG TPA: hypothetical protein VGT02_02905 [Methylomirabilota bacterium]|jgi:hypothetical protein|nr:hypothetical protein [Methylomirabilota bacterium]
MTALAVLVVLALPAAGVAALLMIVDAVQRRRAAVVTRQIQVTDAIHRELGAIVAPTVHRARGGWRVVLPMDARHPDAARVMELAATTLADGRPVEVALLAPWPPTPRRRPPQNRERIASAMSA